MTPLADIAVPPAEERLNEQAPPWHARPVEAVLGELDVAPEVGLRRDEAQARLARYGINALEAQRATPWYRVLMRQFTGPLILILFVAALISVLVEAYVDALTILAIVVLNGALGFMQEWKAQQAIEALRQMLTPQARVRRDGHAQMSAARLIVPGDLVLLDEGDRVPADLRVLHEVELEVDESALTGESVPVEKDPAPVEAATPLAERTSMAWMGTTITRGRAEGVVTATGMQTEFGHIAHLTAAVEDEASPLQRKLAVLGRQLGLIALVVSTLVAVVGWLLGRDLLDMFMTGVSLAVAVVPEGLPAVVTVTLALGIRSMVRRNVLLRHLPAAETLGAATVICTDKTGTLTQNEMTAQHLWMPTGAVALTGVGYDPEGHVERDGERVAYQTEPDLLALLQTALRCNHATLYHDDAGWHATGDPTEAALVVAAYKAWLSPEEGGRIVAEHAFTSERKRMTVIEQTEASYVAHTKGAPEAILPRCTTCLIDGESIPFDADRRAEAEAAYRHLAEQGQRTLALARRTRTTPFSTNADDVETEMTLLGIVGLMDPPRPEVPEAIAKAKAAGIHLIMITGDAAETAQAIGERIGLRTTHVRTGTDLAACSDDDLRAVLRDDAIFARTTPEHKLRIVTLLQEEGAIVGMTGDGVNDAPALKKADIGMAMGGRGTDVAKGASDLLLTDDNFASIISGVEEGRRQHDNILKFVRYLLTSNMGEILAIFTNIVLGAPLLLLPVQILWMNLVTDGLSALALGAEPAEPGTMQRPPRPPQAPILGWRWWLLILVMGTYLAAGTLFLFHYTYSQGASLALAQTIAFTGLVLMEKANVFNFRSLRDPLWAIGYGTNRWLLLAVAGTVLLQLGAVYVPVLQSALQTVPLGLDAWGLIAVVALPVFLIPEALKGILWLKRRGLCAGGHADR